MESKVIALSCSGAAPASATSTPPATQPAEPRPVPKQPCRVVQWNGGVLLPAAAVDMHETAAMLAFGEALYTAMHTAGRLVNEKSEGWKMHLVLGVDFVIRSPTGRYLRVWCPDEGKHSEIRLDAPQPEAKKAANKRRKKK